MAKADRRARAQRRRSEKLLFSWRAAFMYSSLAPTTKLVLHTLASHMTEMGENCFPSVDQICEESSLARATVITHLRLAREAGWLEVRRHGYGGQEWRTHEYWPRIPEESEGGSGDEPPSALSGGEGGSTAEPPSVGQGGSAIEPPSRVKVVQLTKEGGSTDTQKVVQQVDPSTSVSTSGSTSPSASAGADAVLVGRSGRKLNGRKAAGFWRFWDSFGWKHGRAEAVDAWLDIPGLSEPLIDKICAAAKAEARRRREVEARGGKWPWAETWLRARRFEDEALLPPARAAPSETVEDEAERRRREAEAYNADMRARGRPDLQVPVPKKAGGST